MWANWSAPVSADVAHRRAGARRRYNAERRRQTQARRQRVSMMILASGLAPILERGWQARTARDLGVDKATVCRDVDAILSEACGVITVGDSTFRLTYQLLAALLGPPSAATQRWIERVRRRSRGSGRARRRKVAGGAS